MNNIRQTFRVELNNFGNLIGILRSQTPFSPVPTESESTPLSEMPGGFQQEPVTPVPATSVESLTIFDKIIQFVFATLLVIILVPVYIVYRISVLVIFFIAAIIGRLQSPYSRLNSSDPKDVSRNFIMHFDERLQKSITNNDIESQIQLNRPQFLECSYSEAVYKVKKEFNWLLIYIESPHSADSIKFSQSVLINDDILNFINSNNISVWGGDITKSESFQVSNQFNITKLPFLGLLCMTRQQIPTSSGIQQSQPMISLVVKIQGLKDPTYVFNKLLKSYKKYNPGVNSIKLENGINTSPSNGLGSNTGDQYNEWLKWRCSMLPSLDGESPARIAIKFQDGTRKEIILRNDLTVDDIYAFIECKLNNNIHLIPGGVYSEPVGYSHHYNFNLLSSFPDREFLHSNDNRLIRDIPSIYPNGTLMVELR